MSVAEPNSVLISSTTRQLAAGFFEYQGPVRLSLKGFPGPVLAWRPLRASNAEGRFQAFRARNSDASCRARPGSRETQRLWALASRGAGQVALIAGEPGIGKSRLANERRDGCGQRIICGPRTFARPTATPARSSRSRDSHRARRRIRDRRPASASHGRTQTGCWRRSWRTRASTPPSLPNSFRCRAEALNCSTPQQRKEQTLRALLAIIETLAGRRPLLLCFEDAALERSNVTRIAGFADRETRLVSSVLVVVTARPEFARDWRDDPAVTPLALARLEQGEAAKMLEQIPGVAGIAANVRRDILARADGVPLFLEELAKTVLERGAAREPRRDTPQPIPASLHASLLARLDRLDGVREVAQTAAAIGRDFSVSVLGAVTGFSSASLRVALDTLTSAQLVSMTGPPSADRIASSTYWCETRLTAACCGASDSGFIGASSMHWKNNFSEIVLHPAGHGRPALRKRQAD